jgi:hypothetical protein
VRRRYATMGHREGRDAEPARTARPGSADRWPQGPPGRLGPALTPAACRARRRRPNAARPRTDRPARQIRWCRQRRIAAVARFDTTGYESPDCRAFIGEGEPRAIEGLPGTWVGIEFDFTKGENNEKPGSATDTGRYERDQR